MKAVFNLVDNIRLTEDEAGIVTMWKPLDHMVQKLLKRQKLRIQEYTTLTLDEYGSFMIKQIDETTTVEAIGITLRDKFGSYVTCNIWIRTVASSRRFPEIQDRLNLKVSFS